MSITNIFLNYDHKYSHYNTQWAHHHFLTMPRFREAGVGAPKNEERVMFRLHCQQMVRWWPRGGQVRGGQVATSQEAAR